MDDSPVQPHTTNYLSPLRRLAFAQERLSPAEGDGHDVAEPSFCQAVSGAQEEGGGKIKANLAAHVLDGGEDTKFTARQGAVLFTGGVCMTIAAAAATIPSNTSPWVALCAVFASAGALFALAVLYLEMQRSDSKRIYAGFFYPCLACSIASLVCIIAGTRPWPYALAVALIGAGIVQILAMQALR
ncbi:hypothetical protein K488DRAFT_85662 [Vararia minispora EC-137]|uniref:Uncharacterized protein n=1 Tax=Vararia minispora EC-137 TaxID=1314806 RepID=A0ACB8QLW6_9AGAM|nr:hypothetical protein K488DRAFT_85662 [Vararia minispora EC-137]